MDRGSPKSLLNLKTIRIIFTIIIVVMVVISFFAFRTFIHYGENVALRVHSTQMIRALQEIEVDILNAETGHRGYQLTYNPEYLEPYENSKNNIYRKLEYLDSLSLDQSAQEVRIDSLGELVKKQYAIIEEIVSEVKKNERRNVFSQYEINLLTLGRQNMEQIRELITAIEDTEIEILNERIERQESKGTTFPFIFILFNIVAIGVLVYVFYYIYRLYKEKANTEYILKQRQLQLTEAEGIVNMGNWTWYLENNTMEWSEGMYNITKRSPLTSQPTYADFINSVHKEDQERVEKHIHDALKNDRPFDINFRMIVKDSSVRYLHMIGNSSRKQEGQKRSYFGVAQDITPQKNFEQRLMDQSEELKRSNQDLEQFAYVASHDLQEPLRKIRAFGDRLQTKYQDKLEETGADYIERMQNAAERMQGLINDLLTFSRVSRTNQEFEKNKLKDVLKEVLEDLDTAINENNVRIDYNNLPNLTCNFQEMKRLFQNILGNAIKFRKPDITPVIKIRCEKIRGSQVEIDVPVNGNRSFYKITVQDNGIGFNRKYEEQIFNIFQRLHGRSQYKGTGIGLAICKKIVNNHEGYITAHGEEGQGAEFIIYLPKNLKKDIHEGREEIAHHIDG